MRIFSLPPPNILIPISSINTISIILVDPWLEPNNYNIDSFGDRMSLSPIELECEAIYWTNSTNHDIDTLVNWVDHSKDLGSNPLNDTFSTDESIMEIKMRNESPWNAFPNSYLPSGLSHPTFHL